MTHLDEGTHDHVVDGDGLWGKHSHPVSEASADPMTWANIFASGITQLIEERNEYKEKYYHLSKTMRDAFGICGDCWNCYEYTDNEGIPSDGQLAEIARMLAGAFSEYNCIAEAMRKHAEGCAMHKANEAVAPMIKRIEKRLCTCEEIEYAADTAQAH